MDKERAHKRFLQAIEYLKDNGKARNHGKIAEATNTSRPNVSSAISGNLRYITEPFLKRFAAAYPDINEQWLLTGEGEMTKTLRFHIPRSVAEQYVDLINAVIEENLKYRPHVESKASAGFMDGLSLGDYGNDRRPLIPGIPDYDFTITAQGKSMLPRIEEGDVLACRKLTDRLNPPIGKICVLDTKEGWVVKVIESVNEETMTLHSLNPAYRDYEIDLSTILGVAEVVGLVRSFV